MPYHFLHDIYTTKLARDNVHVFVNTQHNLLDHSRGSPLSGELTLVSLSLHKVLIMPHRFPAKERRKMFFRLLLQIFLIQRVCKRLKFMLNIFFFSLTPLSRLFHINSYETGQSVGEAKTGRPREKNN